MEGRTVWIGVRMYRRDDVELFLLALDEGMGTAEAGRLAGVG